MTKNIIYWVRRDLRLRDNPALCEAVKCAKENDATLYIVFVLEDYMRGDDTSNIFSYPVRDFLKVAIPSHSVSVGELNIVTGKGAKSLVEISQNLNASIFVNDDIYPDFYTQISKIKSAGRTVNVFDDSLSVPKSLVTGTGNIYSVYTPFAKNAWKYLIKKGVLEAPSFSSVKLGSLNDDGKSYKLCSVKDFGNLFTDTRAFKAGNHKIDLSNLQLPVFKSEIPYKNEVQAINHFKKFLHNKILDYKDKRDFPGEDGTSKMSLALAWGLITSRTLCQMVVKEYGHLEFEMPGNKYGGAIHYIKELLWREFYFYLFVHHDNLMNTEFQEKYRGTIKWIDDDEALLRFKAWIKGETGYPLVDASMRELATNGHMHNRNRMVVASILTKNLGVDWRWGQEYFRMMLLDIDDRSNNGGWQWGASVGADPKPIRIFNPYLQQENYDNDMTYIKKWLNDEDLARKPIVEHKDARDEARNRYGFR